MMTFDDLAISLPSGFHDAELKSLTIDYTKREARLILDVWVADDLNSEEREAYRLAEVILSGLLFWVSEPPDVRYPFNKAGGKRIDIGPMKLLKERDFVKLPPIPDDAFVNWIFVSDWNAFIYVAAQDAALKWLGEKTVRQSV
jgi:hypothetical protein